MDNFLLQTLLTLGGPAFESLVKRLGGAYLVFGKPFIDSRPFIHPNQEIIPYLDDMPSGGTVTYDTFDAARKRHVIPYGDFANRYYIHIPILNPQKSRIADSTARNVYAKLIFKDLSGNLIGAGKEFDGRWENSAQPSTFENREKLRFIDILPEDSQTLDIAARDINGGCWYVWNNNSYPDYKNPSNMLREDGFIFRLQLNGQNIYKKTASYKFVNAGPDGKPVILEIKTATT